MLRQVFCGTRTPLVAAVIQDRFASFLASRANEQIYNNAGEGSRIIYVCHYAGLIPAGPALEDYLAPM